MSRMGERRATMQGRVWAILSGLRSRGWGASSDDAGLSEGNPFRIAESRMGGASSDDAGPSEGDPFRIAESRMGNVERRRAG